MVLRETWISGTADDAVPFLTYTGRSLGMAAESLWKLGGLSIKELGKRVWHQVDEDEIFTRSAALAYYSVLALFPMMLFLASILGFMAGPGTKLQQGLTHYLMTALPSSASALVQTTIQQITANAGGGKVSFGILFALWSGSAGIVAVMDALNHCYNVKEGRGMVKSRLVAIGLTIVVSLLVLGALTLVLFGSHIADLMGGFLHMGPVFTLGWKIVQWPLALFMMVLTFATIYYYGPDVEQKSWAWITPGAIVGIILWIIATVGVKVYLHFSNSYSQYYGSLGGAMILLLWLFVSGAAFLIGGEVNSEIENAAAKRLGVPTAKAAGEKEPGDKPAARKYPREKRPAA
jgi:membrane protein